MSGTNKVCDCPQCKAAEAADDLLLRAVGRRRYAKLPTATLVGFINDASRELLAGRTVAARKATPSEKCLVILWAWPHQR